MYRNIRCFFKNSSANSTEYLSYTVGSRSALLNVNELNINININRNHKLYN